MTTEQLDMLPLEDPKSIPPPSKKHQETTDPDPEEEPEPAEDTENSEKPRSFKGMHTGYVNIYTWGVRDVLGGWVVISGNPDVGPLDRRRTPHTAEYLTHREALETFEKHPYASQLVDGCDIWACLSDEVETYVVRKEKKDVPAPEAIPGAGSDCDGPGGTEEAPPTPEEGAQGAA